MVYKWMDEDDVYGLCEKIAALEKQCEEVAKEGDDRLWKIFSERYELNRWSIESGFDDPLEFYLHETWKREPRVVALERERDELKAELRMIKELYDTGSKPLIEKLEADNALLRKRLDSLTRK